MHFCLGKTHNATSFAEAFHMVFKVVLNSNEKDMLPSRFARSAMKQINVAMYNMGTDEYGCLREADVEVTEDQMEEGWKRGKNRSYYDAALIQRETAEMELFRPKQLITAIEITEPDHTGISKNNLKFFPNGLLSIKSYYSFTYLKDIDIYLDVPITFYNRLSDYYEKLPFRFNLSLTVQDLLSINNFDDSRNFVTDGVMNIYSLLLLRFYKLEDIVTIFDVRQSTHIFENLKYHNIHERLPKNITNFLIFPFIIESNHWVICFVDLKKFCFSFIDPLELSPKKESINKYIKKLDIFLNKIKKTNTKPKINWLIKEYKTQLIKDKSNSGYQVLILVEMIAEQCKDNCKDFDFLSSPPIDYIKNSIKNDLLINSENVRQYCMKCGVERSTELKKCDICKKICCIECKDIMSSNICIFCKLFF